MESRRVQRLIMFKKATLSSIVENGTYKSFPTFPQRRRDSIFSWSKSDSAVQIYLWGWSIPAEKNRPSRKRRFGWQRHERAAGIDVARRLRRNKISETRKPEADTRRELNPHFLSSSLFIVRQCRWQEWAGRCPQCNKVGDLLNAPGDAHSRPEPLFSLQDLLASCQVSGLSNSPGYCRSPSGGERERSTWKRKALRTDENNIGWVGGWGVTSLSSKIRNYLKMLIFCYSCPAESRF